MDLRSRTTLITGASSGLGREIARTIARRHAGNLVITARRKDRLEELARELRDDTGVDVLPIPVDLTVPAQVESLFEQAVSQRTIDALVLNAGVTYFGRAVEQPLESVERLIATNVTSVAHLATRFGKHFVSTGQKANMLFVSSMASLAPMPYQALYGGTKAFLTNFAHALRHELRRHGIKVGVFLPGGIVTEMTALSGLDKVYGSGDVGMMEAPACARYAVDALRKGSAVTIPGPSNHILATLMSSFPKALVVPIVERLYRAGVTK